ncbi:hypothetical protein FHS19_001654 [Paenibacillus rhizosphaerae]|uniref:Uncharacterized protein n=1 Tax=Paenibacillus rhizosphaerae TaxID=297318 RepID=A0A839TMP5_9BACL|nr:hypothetical protein [Paenibacillus rhizosphaerae]
MYSAGAWRGSSACCLAEHSYHVAGAITALPKIYELALPSYV